MAERAKRQAEQPDTALAPHYKARDLKSLAETGVKLSQLLAGEPTDINGEKDLTPADRRAQLRQRDRTARSPAEIDAHDYHAPGVVDIRGLGLMLAIECDAAERAERVCGRALARGVIALPSGDEGRVVSITPPLCIEPDVLTLALDVIAESLA